jgi:hypothetical protein
MNKQTIRSVRFIDANLRASCSSCGCNPILFLSNVHGLSNEIIADPLMRLNQKNYSGTDKNNGNFRSFTYLFIYSEKG